MHTRRYRSSIAVFFCGPRSLTQLFSLHLSVPAGWFNKFNQCQTQAVLHISVMQSFFFGKGHEPARCEKLRKETSKLRSQILQYDSNASFDHSGVNCGVKSGGWAPAELTPIAKKIGSYCIACELARLFQDMFSTEGKLWVFSRCWWRGVAFYFIL